MAHGIATFPEIPERYNHRFGNEKESESSIAIFFHLRRAAFALKRPAVHLSVPFSPGRVALSIGYRPVSQRALKYLSH